MSKSFKAIIFGGTGSIGRGIFHSLLNHEKCEKILFVSRKPPPKEHEKIEYLEWKNFDDHLLFENDPPNDFTTFKGYDVLFNSLGLSMRKTDDQGYTKLNYTYCVNIGKLSKKCNVDYMYYITNPESNPNSKRHYIKEKGRSEEDLKKLSFKGYVAAKPPFVLNEKTGTCLISCLISSITNCLYCCCFPLVACVGGWEFAMKFFGHMTLNHNDLGIGLIHHFQENWDKNKGFEEDLYAKHMKIYAKSYKLKEI